MIIQDYLAREHPEYRPRTLVHIGAHHAQEMAAYETLGPDLVVWIDAVDDHIAEYRRRLDGLPPDRQAAHRYLVALIADRDGTDREFHTFSNSGASSSIFRGKNALFEAWPDIEETGERRTLKTARLDRLLIDEGIEPDRVDVLIVDAQGSELLCLQGAGRCLKSVRFVEVEVSSEPIYEGGVVFEDLDAWLSKRGFVRRTDVPWHGDVVYERA